MAEFWQSIGSRSPFQRPLTATRVFEAAAVPIGGE